LIPRYEHAAACGLSRATLQNLLRDNERGFQNITIEQFCAGIGRGVSRDELFRSKRELHDGQVSQLRDSLPVIDAIAESGRFDVAGSVPARLVSFSRENRQQFLSDLQVLESLVEALRGNESAAAQWAVATYYLTRADQVLVSDMKPEQCIALARAWIATAALAAAKTSDKVLHATTLLHHASFLYSAGEMARARGVRQESNDVLSGVPDQRARQLLLSRFAVDTASQLIRQKQFDDAERWARQAMELTEEFEDAAWHACATAIHGKVLSGRGDHQQATRKLESAIRDLNTSPSKKSPFLRIMFTKDLAFSLSQCGDHTAAKKVRIDATRDCKMFGFELERRKLLRLTIMGDFVEATGSRASIPNRMRPLDYLRRG
jgi:tetratricopeptide (TPR) repeat protein